MSTRLNFDSRGISTGLEIGDLFADLEIQMIANRKAVFDRAKREDNFRLGVFNQFRTYTEANNTAADTILKQASTLAKTEITKAYSIGVSDVDKAMTEYKSQGLNIKEPEKKDYSIILASSLYTTLAALIQIANYSKQSANNQLLQIANLVNPDAENLDREIDSIQAIFVKNGISL